MYTRIAFNFSEDGFSYGSFRGTFSLRKTVFPDFHVFGRYLLSGRKASDFWGGGRPGIEPGTARLLEPGTKPLG